MVDGTWVMPVYDPLKGSWGFPGEEVAPKKAAAAAPAAAAPAASGLMSRIKKPNGAAKVPETVNLDAPAAPVPVKDTSAEALVEPSEADDGPVLGLSDAAMDKIADLTAKKVISALASALHLVNG
jgi:hypothetical protein